LKTLIIALGLLLAAPSAPAASTIDPVNHYAYGANLGWVDWRGDTTSGATIGQYVCRGYLYAANVGWINLGSGAPTNGIYYQNLAAGDFGVNHDGLGNLRGYAWGANIGWLNFETNGAPTVDLRSGRLSGYIWSANCGWIGLSNAVAYVQTDSFWPGQLDTNGLPVAWELLNFGSTGLDLNADPDHDGMSNAREYLAGTNPNNANSSLRITGEQFTSGGLNANLTWTSVPTRFYHLEKSLNLSSPVWSDSGLGMIAPSAGSTTTIGFTDTNATVRYYRVEAVLPLSPLRTSGLAGPVALGPQRKPHCTSHLFR
jgi:hypothetical protein